MYFFICTLSPFHYLSLCTFYTFLSLCSDKLTYDMWRGDVIVILVLFLFAVTIIDIIKRSKKHVIEKGSTSTSISSCHEYSVLGMLVSIRYLMFHTYIHIYQVCIDVVKSIFVIVAFYVYYNIHICWSPWKMNINFTFFFSVIGPMLSMVPTITVKLSVCINPILYIALNPQVRNIFNIVYLSWYQNYYV